MRVLCHRVSGQFENEIFNKMQCKYINVLACLHGIKSFFEAENDLFRLKGMAKRRESDRDLNISALAKSTGQTLNARFYCCFSSPFAVCLCAEYSVGAL